MHPMNTCVGAKRLLQERSTLKDRKAGTFRFSGRELGNSKGKGSGTPGYVTFASRSRSQGKGRLK